MQTSRQVVVLALEVCLTLVGTALVFLNYDWRLLGLPVLVSAFRPAQGSLRLLLPVLRLLACTLTVVSLSRSIEPAAALLVLALERYLSNGRILQALAIEALCGALVFGAVFRIGTIGQAYVVFLFIWLCAPRRGHGS